MIFPYEDYFLSIFSVIELLEKGWEKEGGRGVRKRRVGYGRGVKEVEYGRGKGGRIWVGVKKGGRIWKG